VIALRGPEVEDHLLISGPGGLNHFPLIFRTPDHPTFGRLGDPMADEHLAKRADIPLPTRRTLLRGAAVAGVAAISGVSLAGCGGDDATTAGGSGTTTAPAAPAETSAPASEPAGGGGAGGAGAGAGLAKTSEIPVGGGKIFQSEKVVVTQPAAGEFKAFSAVCTHQACTVASVSGGTINCACHGSKFSIADGSVKNGPAQRPLPAKTATVNGQDITVT
jgi:Rieske Fe-S protein